MSKSGYQKNTSNPASLVPNSKSGNRPRSYKYEFAAIVLIVVLAIGYSYHRITKSLEFYPEKLFENTFVEPLSTVQDLRGESKAMVGFDHWIRFNCPSGVTLRNAKEFKPYVADAGRSWFAEKYVNDRVLHQPINNYEYLVRSQSDDQKIVNESLLVNKATHDYFYRTWGL